MLCELVLAVVTLFAADMRPAAAEPFKVIAHRDNPAASISRAELSAMFMRRSRRWPHGVDVLPVDQKATSSVRDHFSARVHDHSVAFVIRYWHRVVFSGRGVPPPVAGSDAEVMTFVGANRGGVGYVSSAAQLPPGVKVLRVVE
jgi:ABC-type phosphate transport system substrate-binding protein